MNARIVHRTTAVVVGLYAVVHVANHLLGYAGFTAHETVMKALRHVYRYPPVEALLVASVATQALSGLWLFVRGWRGRHTAVAWVQAGSGLVLAGFLGIHVTAIFFGRTQLHLDTNLYYAAAGMQSSPAELFFGPYYFLGVLAFFVHLGCAFYRVSRRRGAAADSRVPGTGLAALSAAGALVATLLVVLLSGTATGLQVPAQYLATFR